ncbi:MAG: S41 family peptidase [Oligoflexales bacterium]|nr:S41 family peptidase [Oligoflexales bacterium]
MSINSSGKCGKKLLYHVIVTLALFMAPIPFHFGFAAEAQKDGKEAAELEKDYKALETLARGLFYLETLYVDPDKVKPESMTTSAISGIVATLDPHTMLMPKKAFEQLTIDTQGKFGGVGIVVSSENGRLMIVSPIEDTPAFRAGIKSGDEIMAIDGVPVKKMKGGDASEIMRGMPDTKIKLTIKRKGVENLLEFTLTREIIKVKSVRGAWLGEGILYARVSSFQDNTTEELEEELKKRKEKLKGVILDLRDNPGGLLDQAVRMADLFIESGIIVSTVGRSRQNVEREFAHKRGTYSGFPMILLINGGSASASEIVAGALQDHERALVMGTTSFGKGSVQTLVSLPDGSGLKITVARYYTPKDRSIQAKGIQPDIIVEKIEPNEDGRGKMLVPKKEADLKGHIESNDLSEFAKTSKTVKAIEEWPEYLRKDNQITTAYTYLKGWSLFQKKN